MMIWCFDDTEDALFSSQTSPQYNNNSNSINNMFKQC